MTANPSIVPGAVTGFLGSGTDVWLMCLFENRASSGYTRGVAKFLGGRYVNRIFTPDTINALATCIDTTAYNLKSKAKLVINAPGGMSFGGIKTYACIRGEDCVRETCAEFGNEISFEQNIPIVSRNGTPPAVPGGLVITPGNQELTIKWNSVPDPTGLPEVFAYHVILLYGGNPVILGYIEAGLRQVTIGGLSNDRYYNVEVRAVTHNNVSGNPATGTGMPSPPVSNTGTLELKSIPAGARVYMDGADTGKVTPVSIQDLTAGSHTYRLVLAGYRNVEDTVSIKAGMISTVTVQFPQPGNRTGALQIGIGIIGFGIFASVLYAVSRR